MSEGLVLATVLVGGSGTLKRQGLVEGLQVIGVTPLKRTVGPQSPSLPFLRNLAMK
jgi:hypothetical protein